MMKRKITIVVKGIVGMSNASHDILMEVIHRNSKMSREEIDRKIRWLGSNGIGLNQMRSNWEADVEMADLTGMVRDFELLKMVGIIGTVKIKQKDRDIV